MRFVVCLADGDGELIGAGGGLAAAGIPLEIALDLIHGHAVDQLADGLEVAVAAADKLYVGDDVVVKLKIDLRGTDAAGAIRIIHVANPFCN